MAGTSRSSGNRLQCAYRCRVSSNQIPPVSGHDSCWLSWIPPDTARCAGQFVGVPRAGFPPRCSSGTACHPGCGSWRVGTRLLPAFRDRAGCQEGRSAPQASFDQRAGSPVQTNNLIQHEPGMFGDQPHRTAKARPNPSEEEFGEERPQCVLRQVVSLPVEEILRQLS